MTPSEIKAYCEKQSELSEQIFQEINEALSKDVNNTDKTTGADKSEESD